ncbi:MAG: DUF3990 domain-containing protein [Tannerellaceae bacterium]|jgi:hypothetical protein|nr:DUF3990 domain-containing protein [Tannerellaceae bacterium]
MQVYHGSHTEIAEIDLSKGQANKDFGRGFYVTKFRKHAEAWAEVIGSKHDVKGVVTEFKFYERAFVDDVYKTLRFGGYNEQWLDFIVLNRDKSTTEQQHDYDIVEGPVADDKVQNRIDQYLSGEISKDVFLSMLEYHEETHQICFCTRKSLQMIEPLQKTSTVKCVMISESVIEALITDFNLGAEAAADKFYTSKIFTALADKSTGLYLKPWQEIYEMLKKECPEIM